jgi:hypothetical protein
MRSFVLVLTLAACTEGEESALLPGGSFELTVAGSTVTYATASWEAPGAENAHLEFLVDGEVQLVTDLVEGEQATDLPIVGLWVNETFDVRLVDEAGNVRAEGTHTVGSGPVTLAELAISGRPTWSTYVLSALLTSDPPGAVMFSPSGKPCWYWENEGGAYVARARPRRDGAGVWVLLMPDIHTGISGRLLSIGWDGTVLADLNPSGHEGEGVSHDFIELENGALLLIALDTREWEGRSYTAESIMQLDPDGTEHLLWSYWDLYSPDGSVEDPANWTHANALRWNDERQTVWVGSRGLNNLVELSPETWEVLTQFGGPQPSVYVAEGTTPPFSQHHFDFRGNRLLVHDNREVSVGSRVVAYDIEFGDRTVASTVWEYVPSPTVFDFILGDAAWVDDETTLITWSTTGLLEQHGLDGSSPWSVSLLLGTVFGYSEPVPSIPGTSFVGNE